MSVRSFSFIDYHPLSPDLLRQAGQFPHVNLPVKPPVQLRPQFK